jgi:nucleotide-binding universal stress UspA family protein
MMQKINTIWALINEPGNAKEFIRYTVSLAGDIHAAVHVLYVQNPAAFPLGTPDSLGDEVVEVQQNLIEIAAAAERTVDRMISEVKKEIPSETAVDFQSELGDVSSVLEDKVSSGKADMVMLQGQPGESFWARTSTNMDVIRNVHCPIWIIPPDTGYRPLKHIIYATDYQEEDIPTLKKLAALTRPFSPGITALHIVDNKDFEQKVQETGFNDIIRQKAGSDKISLITVVEKHDTDVPDLLNDLAARKGADLIVVLKENRHFLERIFKGSFTRKLIRQSKLPVLVFHEP